MPLRNLESHFHLYQQWIKLAYQRILEIESFASVSRYSLYIMHHLQIADGLVWALVSFPGKSVSESLSMRCPVNFVSPPAFHYKMVLFCKKNYTAYLCWEYQSQFKPNKCYCKSLPFFYFLTFEKADCSIFALSVGWLVDVTINFFRYIQA